MSSHSLIPTPETQLCVGGRVSLWCPSAPFRLQTGTKRAVLAEASLAPEEEALPTALGALCKYSTPQLLPQPGGGAGVGWGRASSQAFKEKRGQGLATGGRVGTGITKRLAPTTGSGSFLPRQHDWPGEVRGQARGVQTVQAFVLRWVWLTGMQEGR